MQHKHHIPRLRLGHLILAQALSTLLVFTTPIFAGSAMAEPAARQYQIPPGSLKDALAQFGREAQVMLSYNSELVSGLHSNGLNKTASVRDGLEQLLAGTGLEAVAQENGGYMLRKSNKPATGSSETPWMKCGSAPARIRQRKTPVPIPQAPQVLPPNCHCRSAIRRNPSA
ncbi:secretin and TonB N-terminal domain-containing protein [Methylobacillus sp. Pita2]|uniref:secretin and TonB N-terminal domain-containing protein n=1 Tax=Methylobacillus sp. Pita2 TaxID=3383245 RepID=UPI0038B55C20